MYLQKGISIKKYFCWASGRYLTKRSGSGSFSERYGSEDPDQYQNVTDPEDSFHISAAIFGPCFDEIASFCRALHCSLLRCCFGQDCGINFSTTLQIGCFVQHAAVKNILRKWRKKHEQKLMYTVYIYSVLLNIKKNSRITNTNTI